MRTSTLVLLGTLVSVLFGSETVLHADTFGSGVNTFDIEFVTIGNPGNPRDDFPNPAGAVAYRYLWGSTKSRSR